MASSTGKVIWKTYDAQHQLLAALVAAHPDLKLDYKKMADFFPGRTESSIEHAMRHIRREADGLVLQQQSKMAHYLGASTPDGLQFQFREIKKNAEIMRANDGPLPSAATAAGNAGNASAATTAATAAPAAAASTNTSRGSSSSSNNNNNTITAITAAAVKSSTPARGKKRPAPGRAATATATKRRAVGAGKKRRAVAAVVAANEDNDDESEGEA